MCNYIIAFNRLHHKITFLLLTKCKYMHGRRECTKYARNECKRKWLPGGQILVLLLRCCLFCSIFVLLPFVTFSILDLNFSCDCFVESKSTDDVDNCWDDMFRDDLCCGIVELIFPVNLQQNIFNYSMNWNDWNFRVLTAFLVGRPNMRVSQK